MEVDSGFEFSRQLLPGPTLASADELFDGGLIRPLKPFHSFPPTMGHLGPIEVTGLQLQCGRAKELSQRPDHLNRITSRSISPLRVSEFPNSTNASSSSFSSSSSSSMGGLKWRLKDLMLFRSASEGRPLNNYSVSSLLLGWKSSGFNGEASSRRLYYRANSVEELKKKKKKKKMKKKTSFSYKQGILGCMGFGSSCGHHQELFSGFGHCFS